MPAGTRKGIIWSGVVLAVAALGLLVWNLTGEEEQVEERARSSATVSFRILGNMVTAPGRLTPSRTVEVGSQVSGLLEKLHVGAGDKVSSGELLAEIDATIQRSVVDAFRAQLRADEARLESQRSAVELAEWEAAREERLMVEEATSETLLKRARDALVQAKASLVQQESSIESQRARLKSEEAKLGYSRINAPVDGTVLEVLASEGQTLTATYVTPVIMQLADLSKLKVEAKVPEANVGKLKSGMGVHFTIPSGAGRRWNSTLDQILPRAEEENGVITYKAVFEVDNSDGALRADMTVIVFFELTELREVLAVPVDMLSQFGQRDALEGLPAEALVQYPDGRIEPRQVRVGEMGPVFAEVLSGLSEGERVLGSAS